jgi:hypothetical protein
LLIAKVLKAAMVTSAIASTSAGFSSRMSITTIVWRK